MLLPCRYAMLHYFHASLLLLRQAAMLLFADALLPMSRCLRFRHADAAAAALLSYALFFDADYFAVSLPCRYAFATRYAAAY